MKTFVLAEILSEIHQQQYESVGMGETRVTYWRLFEPDCAYVEYWSGRFCIYVSNNVFQQYFTGDFPCRFSMLKERDMRLDTVNCAIALYPEYIGLQALRFDLVERLEHIYPKESQRKKKKGWFA